MLIVAIKWIMGKVTIRAGRPRCYWRCCSCLALIRRPRLTVWRIQLKRPCRRWTGCGCLMALRAKHTLSINILTLSRTVLWFSLSHVTREASFTLFVSVLPIVGWIIIWVFCSLSSKRRLSFITRWFALWWVGTIIWGFGGFKGGEMKRKWVTFWTFWRIWFGWTVWYRWLGGWISDRWLAIGWMISWSVFIWVLQSQTCIFSYHCFYFSYHFIIRAWHRQFFRSWVPWDWLITFDWFSFLDWTWYLRSRHWP